MSWSVSVIGQPEDIAAELEAHAATLSGYSKVEFDAALPHFLGLLRENFHTEHPRCVSLTASGHGGEKDGKPHYRNLNCELKPHHFKIARPRP